MALVIVIITLSNMSTCGYDLIILLNVASMLIGVVCYNYVFLTVG